jgi:hypothetical protein
MLPPARAIRIPPIPAKIPSLLRIVTRRRARSVCCMTALPFPPEGGFVQWVARRGETLTAPSAADTDRVAVWCKARGQVLALEAFALNRVDCASGRVFVQTLHPAEGRWGPSVPTFRLTAWFPDHSLRIRTRHGEQVRQASSTESATTTVKRCRARPHHTFCRSGRRRRFLSRYGHTKVVQNDGRRAHANRARTGHLCGSWCRRVGALWLAV